jgi:hypothetical protein
LMLDDLDGHRLDFERVLVEDHQVGELADFERALDLVFSVLARGVDGNRLESFPSA